ncbi:MAG: ATP-dependent Clp protease ATP-binding subunit [Bacillota bacterium]
MFDRFTERARKVLKYAEEEARYLKHNYIGTEHILLGLIREDEGIAGSILVDLDITLDKVRKKVKNIIGEGNQKEDSIKSIGLTPRTKKILNLSMDEARRLDHNYIGTEHILLALVREGEGVGINIITQLGGNLDDIRDEILDLIGGNTSNSAVVSEGKGGTPNLDEYSRDLTELDKEGKLDPVIGRDKEIQRVIQVLSRRTKNNPVLIGEPGVGKTAIVEGLAERINKEDVPEILLNKRVISLDLSAMVAGTKYRGEFEKRLKSVMNDIQKSGDVLLFIDELHTLIGAGAAEGAIDAANILKPALARGEIQTIGATTLDEYRRYFEKDAALERRFQSIMIEENTVEESIEILKGLRDAYEAHHRVQITDDSIISAVKLSYRYIQDRFLPDKAIDLIDEAASKVRLSNNIRPDEFKEINTQLDEVKKEKEAAVENQEFEKAARLRDKEKELENEYQELKDKWETEKDSKETSVSPEDIASIVSSWTGIPVEKLEEKEKSRLLNLEDKLHERVIGQDEAIKSVSQAIRRARSGLKPPKRPIGSFMFLGPTGVGKTELARSLAEAMFDDEDAMIRLDMSEYMEKHSVSRMVGSPPGYVGYDDGGQLTEPVRRKPYSVILFDEIEKAHPDVFNMLLQILEDGVLTDSHGRNVDFNNAVIIMTSNVGANMINSQGSLGFKADKDQSQKEYEAMKEKVMDDLRKTFRPEFINRLDETIVFHSLSKEEIKSIVELMLEDLEERLSEKNLKIELSEAAKTKLADDGYDPDYGARPLRRSIQKLIETPLSEKLISGKYSDGDKIKVDVDKEDNLTFSK